MSKVWIWLKFLCELLTWLLGMKNDGKISK